MATTWTRVTPAMRAALSRRGSAPALAPGAPVTPGRRGSAPSTLPSAGKSSPRAGAAPTRWPASLRRRSSSSVGEVVVAAKVQPEQVAKPPERTAVQKSKPARKMSRSLGRRRSSGNVQLIEHGARSAIREVALALAEACSTSSWGEITTKIKELEQLGRASHGHAAAVGVTGQESADVEASLVALTPLPNQHAADDAAAHLRHELGELAHPRPPLQTPRRGAGEASDSDPVVAAKLFDAATSEIDGFLIDLDGTMYQPGGLIPGAREFYRWLKRSGTPHVFLSNTGAKNATGVQAKFASPAYLLDDEPVPLERIRTAGEAQVDLMLANVPPNARVLVIAGGQGVWRDDLRRRGGARGAALYESWQIRTQLSDDEAKEWAACSACSRRTRLVWVAFFTDGEIHGEIAREGGEEEGFSDWGFSVIKSAGYLLSHGAQFIYTADDAYNPSVDARHPGLMFPLPGPGMFAEMMKKLMYPHGKDFVWCAGKGGNAGDEYMMEAAIQMLVQQGHSGERRRIAMVGDRFDTDVRGGLSAGIRTVLVESGCHTLACQQFYRMDPAHYHAPSLRHLAPPSAQAAAPRAAAPPTEPRGIRGAREEGRALLRERLLQDLRAWTLSQGNLLRPTRADAARAELHPRLDAYFELGARGKGAIELGEVLPALRMLGLSPQHLEHLEHLAAGGGELPQSARAERSVEDSELSFSRSEFTEIVERALAAAGIDARRRWRKAALLSRLASSASAKSREGPSEGEGEGEGLEGASRSGEASSAGAGGGHGGGAGGEDERAHERAAGGTHPAHPVLQLLEQRA